MFDHRCYCLRLYSFLFKLPRVTSGFCFALQAGRTNAQNPKNQFDFLTQFTLFQHAKRSCSLSRGSLENGDWPVDIRNCKYINLASLTPDSAYLSQKMSKLGNPSQRTSCLCQQIFSESEAKKLKKKVWILFYRNENTVEDNVQLSRETDIFEQIMLHVVAWIQNLPHRLI